MRRYRAKNPEDQQNSRKRSETNKPPAGLQGRFGIVVRQ